jgi:hypothetical protein
MKKQISFMVLFFLVGLFFVNMALSGEKSGYKIQYPEGYRGWFHVKSMVIQKGHPLYDSFGGIHHIYANKKALEALKKGKTFPDGAVVIFDLLEARSGDNALVEGSRKVIGVMQKDSKKFKDTGGWGFEGFRSDTKERVVSDPKSACFNCHESQRDTDYVFSKYRK